MPTALYFPYTNGYFDKSHIKTWENLDQSFPLELKIERLAIRIIICTVLDRFLQVTLPTSEADIGVMAASIKDELLHQLNIIVENPIAIPNESELTLY